MKLLSFKHDGKASYGVVAGDGVIDLGRRLGDRYASLRYALNPAALSEITKICGSAKADYALKAIEFLPVIPNPDKIICIGRNYGEHIKEGNREAPEKPMLFPRYPSSHVGHLQALVRPFVSTSFDYEGEIACVIGREARHVSASKALDYVAGYTCFDDGSVRDWQRHTEQVMAGKIFWRSGAIGPWMVTADEIPDPSKLVLTTRVNGQQVQHSGADKMIFDIPYLIEYISTIIDLQPGDIIATGTPEGIGLRKKPPLFLKEGDTLEIEISGIGVLRNPVVDEKRPR